MSGDKAHLSMTMANQRYLMSASGAKRTLNYCQRRVRYRSPPGSETVGFSLFCDAFRSSLVIFQRIPSTVLHAAFAAAGSFSPSPNQVAQSRRSKETLASDCLPERRRKLTIGLFVCSRDVRPKLLVHLTPLRRQALKLFDLLHDVSPKAFALGPAYSNSFVSPQGRVQFGVRAVQLY